MLEEVLPIGTICYAVDVHMYNNYVEYKLRRHKIAKIEISKYDGSLLTTYISSAGTRLTASTVFQYIEDAKASIIARIKKTDFK